MSSNEHGEDSEDDEESDLDRFLAEFVTDAKPSAEGSGFVEELEKKSDTAERVAIEGQRDIHQMRKQWSLALRLLIAAIVLYDLWFIYALGKGVLVYTNDKLVVYFILENLAKIAGLAYIVVNFLFDRQNNK